MWRRSLLASGAVLTVPLALAGCASGVNVVVSGANDGAPAPFDSNGPASSAAGDAAALSQAEQWREAANLPAGAVRVDTPGVTFDSYTGWPCGPYEELEAYWVIPDMTVVDAANWLIENPTADLVTTSFGPVTEEWGAVDGASVGYVPTAESQEGIVYTLVRKHADVVVRAEIAAQTDTATCPPLPDGEMYGAPGMG